jgi:hypothetical protein
MSKSNFVTQRLYGFPNECKTANLLSNQMQDWIVYDLPYLNNFTLEKIKNYACVYFDKDTLIDDTFLEYIKTCNHSHISLFLNGNVLLKFFELSDSIESITIIGVDKLFPILTGKNLRKLYLSGSETIDFTRYDWLPENITELGLIDACQDLNMPESYTIKKIILFTAGLSITHISSSTKSVILPIEY